MKGDIHEGTKILEGKHMISILLYVGGHDGCTKSDLYQAVAFSNNMPNKLDALESAGLLTQSPHTHSVTLSLTETGTEVARRLEGLNQYMIESRRETARDF